MAFFTFSYRLGTSFATYRIRLKIIVIFTYAIISNILLFNKLPCPEAIFLLRRNKDSVYRYYINIVFVKSPDIILFN
jgi:hypothetical protein